MSGRFLLDTDSVSYAIRGQGNVATRMRAEHPSAIHVSSITVAELEYGIARRHSRTLRRLVDAFLAPVQVIPLDAEAARHYGQLAEAMESRGITIDDFDALIAAHALSQDLTLVSNNTKHFSRVPGLKLENWV